MLNLLLLALIAAAGETPPATTSAPAATSATAPAASPLVVSADLRDEYLAGQELEVALTLQNTGTQPLTVPDLSARPWRVRFQLKMPDGKTQSRYNTPPVTEPTTSWVIAPRGQKQVLLAIPNGKVLKPGAYTVTIEVGLEPTPVTLASRAIRIAPPNPVAAHLAPDAMTADRAGLQSLWVHKGNAGFDLYLRQADPADPSKGRDAYLLHVPSAIAPQLSSSRANDISDRYVIWPEGQDAIQYVRLQGDDLRAEPRLLRFPWPRVTLPGQPATDDRGGLHLPVWVPRPQGSGGELWLASLDERGRPVFRKAVALDAAPTRIVTAVDTGGGVHLLVHRGQVLDLYSLRPGYGEDLPLPGKRLWNPAEGQTLLDCTFGSLKQSDVAAGGLAALALWTEGGLVRGQWYSLTASTLRPTLDAAVPAGATVLRATARDTDAPGLLLRSADGALRYVEGQSAAAVSALTDPWALTRDGKGRPVILQLQGGRGVVATALTLSP